MTKRVIRAPYAHVAQLIYDTPLMITPQRLRVILDVIGSRMGLMDLGEPTGEIEYFANRQRNDMLVAARESDAGDRDRERSRGYVILKGGAALIQVCGTLTNRASWLDAASGLTSYERVRQSLINAMEDPHVNSVVLEVDSPGGTANGVFDLVDLMYKLRDRKRMVAVVNDMAASAAYAIASAAHEVWATRTSLTGSIGVIATHFDYSQMTSDMGVKVTHVFAGARKADLSPYFPLSEQAEGWLQNSVNLVYDLFTRAVARNRGISVASVRKQEAGIYTGEEGVAQGLVDRIMTVDEAVDRIVSGRITTIGDAKKKIGGTQMSIAKAQDRKAVEDWEDEDEKEKDKDAKGKGKAQTDEDEEEEEDRAARKSKRAKVKSKKAETEEDDEEKDEPSSKKSSAVAPSTEASAGSANIAADLKRAEEIRALCDAAGRKEMAMDLYLSGMTVEQARIALQSAQAASTSLSTTDSVIGPGGMRSAKQEARINMKDIYGRYNKSMSKEVN